MERKRRAGLPASRPSQQLDRVQKDGLVRLDCPDHGRTLLDGIRALYLEKYKADLEITDGDGQIFAAHQFMLALFSPSFKECFRTNTNKAVDLKNLTFLQHLLDFVYSGHLTVPRTCLEGLLASARRLGVDILVRAIEKWDQAEGVEALRRPDTRRRSSRNLTAAARTKEYGRGKRRKVTEEKNRSSESLGDLAESSEVAGKVVVSEDDQIPSPSSSGDAEETDGSEEVLERRRGPTRRRGRPTSSAPLRGKRKKRRHRVKDEEEEISLKCHLCDHVALKRRYLSVHMANSHKLDASGRPLHDKFSCKECGARFFFGKDLKLHTLKSHAAVKPFRCDECEYATVHKGSLTIHVNIVHRNIRNYVCEVCGHLSAHLSGYKCHARTHTGEKPYECAICQARYADRYNFKLHVLKHQADEKPFVCHLCGHATRRKDNLRSHLARVHKAELPV